MYVCRSKILFGFLTYFCYINVLIFLFVKKIPVNAEISHIYYLYVYVYVYTCNYVKYNFQQDINLFELIFFMKFFV